MQLAISIAAALITLALLLSGEGARRQLLYLGVLGIAVGLRSVFVGRVTRFVPTEVILYLLFGVMFFQDLLKHKDRRPRVPIMLLFVGIWGVGAGLIAWLGGSDWDNILGWTLPLFMGIPTFWVVRRLITSEAQASTMIRLLLVVSAVMSVLALFEYRYPEVVANLPGIFTPRVILTPDGFVRESFSFWGYPVGAVIVTWGMLVAYSELIDPTRRRLRWLHFVLFVLGGLAVYVSGQRSSWIGVLLGIAALSLYGKWKGWVGIAGMFIGGSIFPAVFWERFNTVTVYVVRGTVSDSSIGSRLARWSWGWDAILQNPISGVGYGHWLTHNVFLEIGATIGVLPAIAFLIFLIQLIVRIGGLALRGRTTTARRYGWLLLALAVTWVVQLNVETVFQTLPLAVSFWPFMALAWYMPELVGEDGATGNTTAVARRLWDADRLHTNL